MNNNRPKNTQRKFLLLFTTVLVLCLSTSLFSRSTIPASITDEELFDKAFDAYWRQAWLDAAVNLYAYVQRDPPAMSDKDFSDKVHVAYKHCVTELSNAVSDRNRLAAELNALKRAGGPGKGVRGITQPPPLDKPVRKTSTKAKTMQCDVYARIALTQGELSTKYNCGYAGNRWSLDYNIHVNWCMGSTDSSPEVESAERQKLLAQCANRPSRMEPSQNVVRP